MSRDERRVGGSNACAAVDAAIGRTHTGCMSSTKRGGQRSAADYYPTPGWCVERLLEAVPLRGGVWLEPTAGDGAIVRAVNGYRQRHAFPVLEWHLAELEARHEPALRRLAGPSGYGGSVHIGSFLDYAKPSGVDVDVAILNPPFRIASEVIEHAFELRAAVVVALLRLNYLGSERRAAALRAFMPSVYVLPNRPAFDDRGTDSDEYAWFVWQRGRGQGGQGRISVLESTPRDQRVRLPRSARSGHKSSRSSMTATRSAASG